MVKTPEEGEQHSKKVTRHQSRAYRQPQVNNEENGPTEIGSACPPFSSTSCCAQSSLWQSIWRLTTCNAITWSGLRWTALLLAQHALGLTTGRGLAG